MLNGGPDNYVTSNPCEDDSILTARFLVTSKRLTCPNLMPQHNALPEGCRLLTSVHVEIMIPSQ